jgi:hypothetical protein
MVDENICISLSQEGKHFGFSWRINIYWNLLIRQRSFMLNWVSAQRRRIVFYFSSSLSCTYSLVPPCFLFRFATCSSFTSRLRFCALSLNTISALHSREVKITSIKFFSFVTTDGRHSYPSFLISSLSAKIKFCNQKRSQPVNMYSPWCFAKQSTGLSTMS